MITREGKKIIYIYHNYREDKDGRNPTLVSVPVMEPLATSVMEPEIHATEQVRPYDDIQEEFWLDGSSIPPSRLVRIRF